jgi:hypothetical protein
MLKHNLQAKSTAEPKRSGSGNGSKGIQLDQPCLRISFTTRHLLPSVSVWAWPLEK